MEETNAAGLNTNYTLLTTESVQKVEGLVMTTTGVSAELINKYERKRGSLTVTKSWEGDDIGDEAKAALSITITGKDIGGEGINTRTIGYADLPFSLNNLPVGESYTVEETNAAGLNANYTLITTESIQKVEDLVMTTSGVSAGEAAVERRGYEC